MSMSNTKQHSQSIVLFSDSTCNGDSCVGPSSTIASVRLLERICQRQAVLMAPLAPSGAHPRSTSFMFVRNRCAKPVITRFLPSFETTFLHRLYRSGFTMGFGGGKPMGTGCSSWMAPTKSLSFLFPSAHFSGKAWPDLDGPSGSWLLSMIKSIGRTMLPTSKA